MPLFQRRVSVAFLQHLHVLMVVEFVVILNNVENCSLFVPPALVAPYLYSVATGVRSTDWMDDGEPVELDASALVARQSLITGRPVASQDLRRLPPTTADAPVAAPVLRPREAVKLLRLRGDGAQRLVGHYQAPVFTTQLAPRLHLPRSVLRALSQVGVVRTGGLYSKPRRVALHSSQVPGFRSASLVLPWWGAGQGLQFVDPALVGQLETLAGRFMVTESLLTSHPSRVGDIRLFWGLWCARSPRERAAMMRLFMVFLQSSETSFWNSPAVPSSGSDEFFRLPTRNRVRSVVAELCRALEGLAASSLISN